MATLSDTHCDRTVSSSRAGLVERWILALRTLWSSWRSGSAVGRVWAASVVLTALGLICKLAAGIREIVTAYWFGTGDALDALVIALTIPTFAAMALGNAAGLALLPTLTRVRERDGEGTANELLRETTFWVLILLVGACVLCLVSGPWLLEAVSPSFAPAKQTLARHLLTILLPMILLRGLISLYSNVLNSQERFAASGLVPVLTPLVSIVLMLALGSTLGIYALALGLTAGCLAESLALGWALHAAGYRLLPRIALPSGELYQVFRQYWPLVIAAMLMSSTTIVDHAMACQLGSGSVATLSYGHKLVLLVISIPTLSVSRAVFPYLSRLAAQQRWRQLSELMHRSQLVVMLTVIPLTIGLFLFSRPLTALVLQHGEFSVESTDSVAWVQSMYALQIPFYTSGMLYVRLISSLGRNYLLTLSTIVSIVLNIVLNYVLMRSMGVAGIALSTSIVYAAAWLFLMGAGRHSMRCQSAKEGDEEYSSLAEAA